ncbi:MAG: outer membrane lipoprotein-sorting protein [Spirochaetota bacterium]
MTSSTYSARAAALALALVATLPLAAQALTGPEIMDKHFHTTKPASLVMTMSMTITKNGKNLSRSMSTWGMGDNAKGEVERKLIKFLAPGDIKGSGFLSSKKVDGSTESQLWLPAMGKVRRLSSGASDQDQAFFGSDFTNRDISGFVEAEFSYELKGEEEGAFIIEAKPRSPMTYERLVYRIDIKDFGARRIDYWKGGKLFKFQTLAYTEVEGFALPSRILMTASSGSTTEIRLSDQKVGQDLGGQVFTERFLKQ